MISDNGGIVEQQHVDNQMNLSKGFCRGRGRRIKHSSKKDFVISPFFLWLTLIQKNRMVSKKSVLDKKKIGRTRIQKWLKPDITKFIRKKKNTAAGHVVNKLQKHKVHFLITTTKKMNIKGK
jgi:hypothetical protein